MADPQQDLNSLQEWVKKQLFNRVPNPTTGQTSPVPQAVQALQEPPDTLPKDDTPGLLHSLGLLGKSLVTEPHKVLAAIGKATTPSDTPAGYIPPDAKNEVAPPSYVPVPPGLQGWQGAKQAPPSDRSRVQNLLLSAVPDAAQKAFSAAQAQAPSPQTDAAGKQVVNHDANILMPLVKAGAAAAYELSPAENILNVLRGAKVDPATGKEVPLTGPQVMEEMTTVAMKTAPLEASHLKMPNLEEVLGGSHEVNLDPIVKNTKFQGEINSAVRAKELNTAEAAATARQTAAARTAHGPQQDITAGSSDVPIDARGEAVADDLPDKFPNAHRIVTSGVLRAQQTAEPLTRRFPDAVQEINPQLDAMHKALYEGQLTDQANKAILAQAKTHPDAPLPGVSPLTGQPGESWNAFGQRVVDVSKQILDDAARDPEATHVYFTHSDVIKGMAAHAEDFTRLKGPAASPIDPDTFAAQTSGMPGSIFRYARDENGVPKLFDATGGAEGPGAFIVRHGETPWDPPSTHAEPTNTQPSNIPRSLEAIEALRQQLPSHIQDQYLQQLPKLSWIQDRVADWVFAPQFVDWMKDYDPANKDTNPFHEAAAQFLASPDAKSHFVEDLQDHYNLSPQQLRSLSGGELDQAAQYAGQVNKTFSDAVKGFQDYTLTQARQATTVGEAANANKLLQTLTDFRQRLADGNAGSWAKTNNWLNNIENLRRSVLVGSLDTAINIAKSHGLISLTDGIDAMHSSLLKLVTNSGKNLTDALVNGKMPDKPLGQSFREDMGDAMSFANAFVSRAPWIPDLVAGRVHWDPAVYGIDADTYNAIKTDAAKGMPTHNTKPIEGQPDLVTKYADSGLHSNIGIRRQQIDDIVGGVSHRNVVNDLLSANPMGAARVLGGFMHDIDMHLFGPQVSLLSKSVEQAMNAYRDEPSGVVGKAKAAWESGQAGLQQTIKELPFEAFWGKGGIKENMQAFGKDAFNTAKMGADFQNVFNRLQMYELSRFQYHMHFTQNLKDLGMSEDQALAQMQNTRVQRDPQTGLWQPVPADPRLREAAANAELTTMKNTLRMEPKSGVLGSALDALKNFSQKFFPLTPFFLTFPRYAANYILYAASHSPTKLLDLFSKDFREKIAAGDQQSIRSLSRGMTGLAMTAVGYTMSQGHKIGGYTMGPKPYLMDNGTKDADGNPKYLHIDTIGPVNFYLHLGHITDSLVNGKPINLNADEWQDFLSGAKTLDAPLFALHDTVRSMEGTDPESKLQAAGKLPGTWMASWLRFWKGGQDDAAALGLNLPQREQRTDTYGQSWIGPTLNNINPASLPARVNPFSGKLDIEQHPTLAEVKMERRPMYPMEKWMTDLGVDTNTITPNVHDAVANNKLRALSGFILNTPAASKALTNEALGVDMPLEQFISTINAALPQRGPQASRNREIQTKLLDQVVKTLHTEIKDSLMKQEIANVAAGRPSTFLSDEIVKQEAGGKLSEDRAALQAQLKALGIR